MRTKINGAVLKRLDALTAAPTDDAPDITLIDRDSKGLSIDERYHLPGGVKYRRFTVNTLDEYTPRGGVVLHKYDLQD
ncbi:hypothetical protein FACS18949_04590 [Clostridia bacterium]|nr:hypothetical protein FACS189425_07400 [Clostridia bacterium]GHV32729.1 hypothetical protein FACS18949_04590 [Clostridia bacterium]